MFPSKEFYDGDLRVGTESQQSTSVLSDFWPAYDNMPILFVDVVGRERSLAVDTGYGSEKSKWNRDEIVATVRKYANCIAL
jgi:superfamily I DNA and/or RNA helicase